MSKGHFAKGYDPRRHRLTRAERRRGYRAALDKLGDGSTTLVVEPGPKFKVLGKNTIDEMGWSSPAVGAKALFLRTVDHLYCIKREGGQRLKITYIALTSAKRERGVIIPSLARRFG